MRDRDARLDDQRDAAILDRLRLDLFARNAGELYLVVDEFHNFAPKTILYKGKKDDEETASPMLALHWANRLLSEGRGLGIVSLNASQRPQKVHNDSLTSHETLIAMRVIHKADRDAIAGLG
jgi:DNA helicase HerA-like ATPase